MDAPGLINYERGPDKMNDEESSPIFPSEVIIEILSWLPIKSLLQLQLVCKQWQALTRDRYFIEKHMSCSSFTEYWHVDLHNDTTLLGSDTCLYVNDCDGLLLLVNDSSNKYYIWNPAICRVLELPDPHDGSYGIALSYVPATRNYRIVSMFKDYESGGRGCEVFTPHHSKTWRRLAFPDFCNANEDTLDEMFSVVSAGGAVHCVLDIEVGNEFVAEIVTLDLETECFTVNHLPSGRLNASITFSEMAWEGKLAFAVIVGKNLELIVLEDYKKQRWCEKTIIPLPFMNYYDYDEGDIFPVLGKQGHIWFCLRTGIRCIYTIKGEEVTDIKELEFYSVVDSIYPYKPSLVSFEGMVPETNLETFQNYHRLVLGEIPGAQNHQGFFRDIPELMHVLSFFFLCVSVLVIFGFDGTEESSLVFSM